MKVELTIELDLPDGASLSLATAWARTAIDLTRLHEWQHLEPGKEPLPGHTYRPQIMSCKVKS